MSETKYTAKPLPPMPSLTRPAMPSPADAQKQTHAPDAPAPGWDRALFAKHGIRTVLDVGANYGGFIPSWLDCGARVVHAIEPVPECFDQLAQRFADDPRVTCHKIGVSNKPGELAGVNVFNCWTLQADDAKTFHRAFDFVGTPPFDVELDSIDRLLTRWAFAPGFIKIDVDGYDVRALQGAANYIERHRPVLMLEISYMPEVALGDCYACEIRKLMQLGYTITKVNGGHRFASMKEFQDAFPWHTSWDVICEPASPAL